jgi:hypothetical protein
VGGLIVTILFACHVTAYRGLSDVQRTAAMSVRIVGGVVLAVVLAMVMPRPAPAAGFLGILNGNEFAVGSAPPAPPNIHTHITLDQQPLHHPPSSPCPRISCVARHRRGLGPGEDPAARERDIALLQ